MWLGGTKGKMQGEAVLSTPGSGGFGLVLVPLLPPLPASVRAVKSAASSLRFAFIHFWWLHFNWYVASK